MNAFTVIAGKRERVRVVGAGKGTKAGARMSEQAGLHVVLGRKQAGRVGSLAATGTALREGTTGRLLTLPRVLAVAEKPVAGQIAPKFEATGPETSLKQTAPKAEMGFYRKYTEALLRRYVQMSMEAGRVPSMMGRSVLGGKASSYRIHGFDDAVNFRLDVERCLLRLDAGELEVIRRVAMQEYTQAEAAALLGICLRTCVQRYGRALDTLTGILLEVRLLEPFRGLSSGRRQLGMANLLK